MAPTHILRVFLRYENKCGKWRFLKARKHKHLASLLHRRVLFNEDGQLVLKLTRTD